MINRVLACMAVVAISLSVVACGSSAGFLRDSITQVQVQRPGFKVVKTNLSASADAGSLFCAIPIDDGQVYRKAMEGLHARASLAPNQMLINIREDVKSVGYLGFYCSSTHTLSADVIELTGEGAASASTPVVAPAPVSTTPAAATPAAATSAAAPNPTVVITPAAGVSPPPPTTAPAVPPMVTH